MFTKGVLNFFEVDTKDCPRNTNIYIYSLALIQFLNKYNLFYKKIDLLDLMLQSRDPNTKIGKRAMDNDIYIEDIQYYHSKGGENEYKGNYYRDIYFFNEI